MPSTPQGINAAVGSSATTLYTFPASGPTRAQVVSLDFTNTTNADISLDVWWEDNSGTPRRYLADDMIVPAKGSASWRGVVVLQVGSDKLRAQGAAAGIDALGMVLENA